MVGIIFPIEGTTSSVVGISHLVFKGFLAFDILSFFPQFGISTAFGGLVFKLLVI